MGDNNRSQNTDETVTADQPNAGEGADPSGDLKQQNAGETTTADLTEEEGAA